MRWRSFITTPLNLARDYPRKDLPPPLRHSPQARNTKERATPLAYLGTPRRRTHRLPVNRGASDYGSVGWRSVLPEVCRLFDDGDVRPDTGELPNSSDGDLRGELQG